MAKSKKRTVTVPSYDWKITARKFVTQFLLVGLLAALLWASEEGLPGLILEHPQYAALLSLASAIIIAIFNYISHYKDTKEIEV